MTKKKPPTKKTTTTKPPDTIIETAQTPGQKYEEQLQQTLDDWVEASIEDLEARNLALDLPDGRKFKPETSETLRSALRNLGARLVKSWHLPPPRPPTAELPRHKPSAEDLRRAEQRRHIEESSRYEVPLRELINKDRARFGWAPLPPPEDETSEE